MNKKDKRGLDRHIEREDDYGTHVIPSVVDIDENELEQEWASQSRLCESHMHLLAHAKKELSDIEAEQEVTEAEIKDRIRKQPEEYGLDKVTENSVMEAMVRQKERKEAIKKVNEAKLRVDLLAGTVKAIDHRKTALENLYDAKKQGWYSSPKSKDGDRDQMEVSSRKAERRKHK